ncbi:uncharacterized protein [Physcomitrium patens]|uniref:uncharacterized protein isoform X2 n=1 Tax=Physcomitrium patens TaxID=3218 RepID=UPI000D16398D|nr:uncharacterized protein LOC112276801 isoform X2 [Physcomitrium patens]|eukprot:XP_024364274.1 uncharacterized protein LOC112276801 isoform X2 [Physcomitrella patens]
MIEQEGDAAGRDFSVVAWGTQGEGAEVKDMRGGMTQAKRGSSRRIQQRGNWSEESMKEAIKEVKKGTASIGKIGEKYGIPESSIRDWLTGKTSSKKKGPRTVLTKEEEDSMVDWCLEMQRNGHPITFYMLRRKVADVCQGRETPFRNGVPGKSWMDWFRKRHPTVMIEAAHALKGKKRSDTPRALLDGLIAREEEDAVNRDLFGAAGSEPSPMDSHDPRDIMLQLMQQEPHMDGQLQAQIPNQMQNQMQTPMSAQMQGHLSGQISSQLPTQLTPQLAPSRGLEAVNQEESTPGYEPWKGQERGDQDHERDEAGRNGFDSEDSGSFPSSNSNPGGRWTEFVEGMAGLERAIRESEERKDRRLERQLEANERIATSLIVALGQVSECLRTIGSRGMGGGDLGQAVSALGNLGGLSAELSAGLSGGLGDQQP